MARSSFTTATTNRSTHASPTMDERTVRCSARSIFSLARLRSLRQFASVLPSSSAMSVYSNSNASLSTNKVRSAGVSRSSSTSKPHDSKSLRINLSDRSDSGKGSGSGSHGPKYSSRFFRADRSRSWQRLIVSLQR